MCFRAGMRNEQHIITWFWDVILNNPFQTSAEKQIRIIYTFCVTHMSHIVQTEYFSCGSDGFVLTQKYNTNNYRALHNKTDEPDVAFRKAG